MNIGTRFVCSPHRRKSLSSRCPYSHSRPGELDARQNERNARCPGDDQLQREQDDCSEEPHAVAAHGVDELVAPRLSSLHVIRQLASCSGLTTQAVGTGMLLPSLPLFILPGTFVVGGSREVEAVATEAAAALSSGTGAVAEVEAAGSPTARETLSSAREAPCTPEAAAAAAAEAATLATHHAEQDFGVNAPHAAHAATHATTAEHVGGVHEIIAVVIAGLLPAQGLVTDVSVELEGLDLLRVAQGLVCF